MIVKISDFGPLKSFKFDLSKKFIVTYGNNNIGKSYAMQIVYLLIKTMVNMDNYPFMYRSRYSMSFETYDGHINEQIMKTLDEFYKSEKQEMDITNKTKEWFYITYQEMFMPSFVASCNNTFGNFDKIIDNSPCIEVELGKYNFCIDIKKGTMIGGYEIKPIMLKRISSDRNSSRNNKNHFDVYIYENDFGRPLAIILEELRKVLTDFTRTVMMEFDQVYFLPASRSGIYSGMNAFGSIIAELSKNRAMLTRKIELPGISEPISDYFIALSNIRPRNNIRFEEYYSKIENEILKGVVTFDKSENALVYTPKDMNANFEMTEVSSMVSEISPIVAFLKYILGGVISRRPARTRKSILFIEEPEAHLHPNNQIKLIEIFSELASAGVNLVISSHSNYIFNKINNLILSKKLDYNIYQPIFLEQTPEGSEATVLDVDVLWAVDRNFVDVSELLYQEREEIIKNFSFEEE